MTHDEENVAHLMTGAVRVTPEMVDALTANFPFAMRQAVRFAMRIERGRLIAVHPRRAPLVRRFVFEGTQAGPEATIIINDIGFAKRLIDGGDIGIAEGYLRGEWESPNLTRFLELFCVNHPMIQRML
jgi:cyclopropane-fatty-acyl-phospholipid synthase